MICANNANGTTRKSKANKPPKLRIFVDADVLFAGAASPNEHSDSLVILRMAEITLIEALTSEQVITEVECNLEEKRPAAMPAFRMLLIFELRKSQDHAKKATNCPYFWLSPYRK
jgi:predicted nucleic acid-binding protein